MHSSEIMNNISVEQFAAFLDGNLSEEAMQNVTNMIDSDEEYTNIMEDVMQIDESVDIYMMQPDVQDVDFLDSEFELPIVPKLVMSDDIVELSLAHPEESDTVIVENADVLHGVTSDISAEDEILASPHVNENCELTPTNGFDAVTSLDAEQEIDCLD